MADKTTHQSCPQRKLQANQCSWVRHILAHSFSFSLIPKCCSIISESASSPTLKRCSACPLLNTLNDVPFSVTRPPSGKANAMLNRWVKLESGWVLVYQLATRWSAICMGSLVNSYTSRHSSCCHAWWNQRLPSRTSRRGSRDWCCKVDSCQSNGAVSVRAPNPTSTNQYLLSILTTKNKWVRAGNCSRSLCRKRTRAPNANTE